MSDEAVAVSEALKQKQIAREDHTKRGICSTSSYAGMCIQCRESLNRTCGGCSPETGRECDYHVALNKEILSKVFGFSSADD